MINSIVIARRMGIMFEIYPKNRGLSCVIFKFFISQVIFFGESITRSQRVSLRLIRLVYSRALEGVLVFFLLLFCGIAFFRRKEMGNDNLFSAFTNNNPYAVFYTSK